MSWTTIVPLILPYLMPVVVSALVWVCALIGTQLFHFLVTSRFKSIAATIVSVIEDTHDNLDGNGKLKLAVDSLASKAKFGGVQLISNKDAEDLVREAYIALIKPLDGLKDTAVSPSSSTASVK